MRSRATRYSVTVLRDELHAGRPAIQLLDRPGEALVVARKVLVCCPACSCITAAVVQEGIVASVEGDLLVVREEDRK